MKMGAESVEMGEISVTRLRFSLRRAAVLLGAAALIVPFVPAAHSAPMINPTVLGGSDITIADAPWQILFIINDESVCGGALVSSTHVISAAHCFEGFATSKVQAWAGITEMSDRSDANRLPIKSIAVHPAYDPSTFANDIAVVTLKVPVPARLRTATIGLPAKVDTNTWPALDATATVTGWGESDVEVASASNTLQAAVVDIMASPSAATCGQYGAAYLPDKQICAGVIEGGVDACSGDSGGPLTMYIEGEPVLAGVSSTGLECGLAGYPGLYVRITSYLPWLAGQGIDINASGGAAIMTTPGTSRQGVPASFVIGQTYPRSVFAKYAGLNAVKSRLTFNSGSACTLIKQSVRIDKSGKCRLTINQGKKSIPIVVTVYSL